jgi:hypothetical protein
LFTPCKKPVAPDPLSSALRIRQHALRACTKAPSSPG